jgi:hypothetical protein
MKKYLCVLPLLLVLVTALPRSLQAQDEVIVGDDDGTGMITTIRLIWEPNREPDIAGYNVYYGRVSGDCVPVVSVVEPMAMIKIRGQQHNLFRGYGLQYRRR